MPTYEWTTNAYTTGVAAVDTNAVAADARYYYPVDNNTYTINATDILTVDAWTPNEKYQNVTKADLDEFAHKIYDIIKEYTRIDISEDEFMNILQGGDK